MSMLSIKKSNSLFIFGTAETAEIAKFYFNKDSNYKIKGFVVDDEYVAESNFISVPVLSWSEFIALNKPKNTNLHVALSYKKLNSFRESVFNRASDLGFNLTSYISTHAYFEKNQKFGSNCFILENNVMQLGVKILDNVMLWSGNHVGHGTTLHKSVYLSSHVVISGHSNIGARSFFGVNSATRDFINIGEDCFIGMGSNIVKDMKSGSIAIASRSDYISSDDIRSRKLLSYFD